MRLFYSLFCLKRFLSISFICRFFNEYSCPDYARSGNTATEDVNIVAGSLDKFQHTMEPQLRRLGLHTSLKKGIVTLDTDHQICKKGDKLTPEQAQLLVLFYYVIFNKRLKINLLLLFCDKSETK